jgi:hypothetical protein
MATIFYEEMSELPHIVFKFYDEIFVQFNGCINILRSDNVLEYM